MGDRPGHRFRGNQWTGARRGAGGTGTSSRGDWGEADRDVRNSDGTLKDDRSGEPPAPGEPFVVYRLGRSGTTELQGNAGNAEGVADHLIRTGDSGGGHGDTIHAFRVTVNEEFGDYQMIRGGQPQTFGGLQAQTEKVGRLVMFDQGDGRAGVVYSFDKAAKSKYKAEKIGQVTLNQAEQRLKAKGLWDHVAGGGRSIGAGGTLSIADGIREVFRG